MKKLEDYKNKYENKQNSITYFHFYIIRDIINEVVL